MQRRCKLAVKCFVPTCSNTTTSQKSKCFVYVNKTNCKTWCKLLDVKFKPTKRYFCCEEHLDLKEDLINYEDWKRGKYFPKLKPHVILKNYTGLNKTLAERIDLQQMPCVLENTNDGNIPSTGDVNIESESPPPQSILKELLLKDFNLPKRKPTTPTTIVPAVKVSVGVQCKVKMVDKSTMVNKRKCNCGTFSVKPTNNLDPLSTTPSGTYVSALEYIPSVSDDTNLGNLNITFVGEEEIKLENISWFA